MLAGNLISACAKLVASAPVRVCCDNVGVIVVHVRDFRQVTVRDERPLTPSLSDATNPELPAGRVGSRFFSFRWVGLGSVH